MSRAVGVRLERLDRIPYREVDQDVGLVEHSDIGQVAIFFLQPLHESRSGVGSGVDLVQRVHELGHDGTVGRPIGNRDVYLGQLPRGEW